MWLILILLVVLGALTYTFYFRNSKNIFQQHGILEIDTSPGASKLDILLSRKGMSEWDTYAYKALGSEKFCGISQLGSSVILVKDMDLIKKVFIKDFDYFMDRREFFSEAEITVKKMLSVLEGEEWKNVRMTISPVFTSGKIRRMMSCFNEIGREWVENFMEKANNNPDGSVVIKVLDSVNQYTIDVISSAVFGMQSGTIKNPKSTFAVMADRLTNFTKWQLLKFAMATFLPNFVKILRLKLIDSQALEFFEGILDQGLKARMSGSTTKRNDFLQLLVEAKKGELKAEGNDELSSFEKDAQIEGGEKKKTWLTEQIMNSQTVGFLFAGASTVSNAISSAIYALALNQDVQERVRNEVKKIIKPDGTLDYDDLSSLVYMDMVISEVLRKFPALTRLERKCVRDYRDAETGLFVPKGTLVIIPVHAIHHNPEYYEHPDKFYPEHFTPEKKCQRSTYSYLPFGMGPRSCIGARFAMTEIKSAIAHVVNNFVIEPTAKTPVPLKGCWAGFMLLPPKGLELRLTPLKK
ncbi:Cytochrome P450 9e2 [Orchesella cincta]|uniref:Cytochrome P450 9e2 n=1 Tax=Orchesella cincta TaxID=48709 RepID=A0A1D2MNA3_ORCCI|nr:Cytochrome P450 9e2 [Orchesella cincta]